MRFTKSNSTPFLYCTILKGHQLIHSWIPQGLLVDHKTVWDSGPPVNCPPSHWRKGSYSDSSKRGKLKESHFSRIVKNDNFRKCSKIDHGDFSSIRMSSKMPRGTQHIIYIWFESVQKKSKIADDFTKWDFRKLVQAYLTHFSFLHMTSIYTIQGTSGCRGGPWHSLKQNK